MLTAQLSAGVISRARVVSEKDIMDADMQENDVREIAI